MKVFDLQCLHGHVFEGWFASEVEFARQKELGLMECPMCGNVSVTKMLSAPRLNLGSLVGSPVQPEAMPAALAPETEMQRFWLAAARQVVAGTEDVGVRFAEEARKIHYGETAARGIRGQATASETERLREEGIEVLAFPLPESFKQPLQ